MQTKSMQHNQPDGWDGILEADETLLWQGRPDGAFVWPTPSLKALAPVIAICGFSVFWMMQAAQSGGFFWLLGLVMFSAGISAIFRLPLRNMKLRRSSWYSLSNRRAFFATETQGQRHLKSYDIHPDLVLELVDGTPGSVYFATTFINTSKGSSRQKIGFERIADARGIYDMLRKIQRGQA